MQNESPGHPYGSPNLPDKSKFGYFFLQKKKSQVIFISKLKNIYIAFSCRGWLYCCEILFDFGLRAPILGTFTEFVREAGSKSKNRSMKKI